MVGLGRKAVSRMMLIVILTSMFIVLLDIVPTPVTGQAFSSWEVFYPANKLPNESEPPWKLEETFVDDTGIATVSDGILTLNTLSENAYWMYRRDWGASNNVGITIEARVKIEVADPSYYGMAIFFADGVYQSGLFFFEDKVRLHSKPYAMNTKDAFHTYRILMKGNKIMLYVDGTFAVEDTVSSGNPYNYIRFGDIEAWPPPLRGYGIAQWDYVAYTTKGDFVAYGGLVGYWKFEEGAGAIAHDSSGNNNHGTIYGASWTVGRSGKALSFDGIDDYVRIPDSDSLDITGDLTITAWVKTSQTSPWSIIFSNCREVSPHDGYKLEMTSLMTYDGNIRFYSQESQLFSIGRINTGTWKHVAVTLSGTVATIYIDGVFDNSGTVNVPNTNDLDQTIGASYLPYYFFKGIIDEVQIYNRALSEEEIRALAKGLGYFVIVAGNNQGNLLDKVNYGCNEVFKILRSVGYSGDSIYYMNQPEYYPQDVDGDGQNDIDALSSSTNLQWVIETWASTRVSPTRPLFLYLFDHGDPEIFYIDEPDQVSSTQLEFWLNNLEGATNAPIHVIYAACHSGSFINELSESGRVITTSCQPTQGSWVSADGKWEAFSQPFWIQIESGHSIAWSFNTACSVVAQQGFAQTPLLDDNGDDTGHTGPLPNGGDGLLASNVYIGSCEWPFPWIKYVIRKQFFAWPPPATITLWAKVENKTPLVHVRAWMQPPDWLPPPPDTVLLEMELECFEMADADHDGNFTVNVPAINFTNHATEPSDFKFIITAEEENGKTAIPVVTGVGFTETGQPPVDSTSPIVYIERPLDKRFVQGIIKINGTTADNVCLKNVEFYVEGNLIETVNVLPASNSFFELDFDTRTASNGAKTILMKAFDTSGNSGNQTLIVVVDNPTPPPPVGGVWISVDKFGLLAPYIGLASTILVATVATAIYVKRVKHRKEKQ